jgi:hypothetical protein
MSLFFFFFFVGVAPYSFLADENIGEKNSCLMYGVYIYILVDGKGMFLHSSQCKR